MEDRFTRLAGEAGPRLLAYLVRRVEAPVDAADLVSEVFTVAWRRAGELPADDSDATGWLFGVARGVLANHRRASGRRTALLERLREQVRATQAHSTDTGTTVRAALARLRPADRELLTLQAWEELSTEQIAVAMAISPAAVRQRLHRARERLRAELDRTGGKGVAVPSGLCEGEGHASADPAQ
ncbi:sigma-70 family RNA polymerase sigma factor [Actinoplanes sp. NPDC051861]|uniref:RNA polymerase sigma factor n=1 Tax=Actinoplanes sp. NPDC051861 TaxID=3155170 RepID=UPI00344AD550